MCSSVVGNRFRSLYMNDDDVVYVYAKKKIKKNHRRKINNKVGFGTNNKVMNKQNKPSRSFGCGAPKYEIAC